MAMDKNGKRKVPIEPIESIEKTKKELREALDDLLDDFRWNPISRNETEKIIKEVLDILRWPAG